jgi:hypothetical protein
MNSNFIFPECDIVIFENEDIITVSANVGDEVKLPDIL